MSERITFSLDENSWELQLIEAVIEEITTQNDIAEVLMWDDGTAKLAAMTLKTRIREAKEHHEE